MKQHILSAAALAVALAAGTVDLHFNALAQSSPSVSILAWNVEHADAGLANQLNYINSLSPKPQVIYLEEVNSSDVDDYVSGIQAPAGQSWNVHHAQHCKTWSGDAQTGTCTELYGEDVVFLTTLPIVEQDSELLYGPDTWIAARRALYMKVQVQSEHVALFGTHLTIASETARVNQVNELKAWAASKSASSRIVVGDFNSRAEQSTPGAAYQAMLTEYSDAWKTLRSGENGASSFTWDATATADRRIDFIFYQTSSSLTPQSIDRLTFSGGALSDHYPLRSTLTIGTPTNPSLPSPWSRQDVGNTAAAGSASYASGTFTVQGSGADIWGQQDSFSYVYQPLAGDGSIVARVASMQNTSSGAKAGIMIRQALSSNAAHVLLSMKPNGQVEFMRRASLNAQTEWLGGNVASQWLKLTRSGSQITSHLSSDGTTWTPLGTTTVPWSGAAYVGLIVCARNNGVLNTSTFTNVNVTGPPNGDIVIYANEITNLNGTWALTADSTAAAGFKLETPNSGVQQLNAPLAAPADYFDVAFTPAAGVPYRIWLRLRALDDDKFNDAVWVQFTDARVNGTQVYPLNSTSGLLVNLAPSSDTTTLSNWGWQNGAYWLSQQNTVTFPTSASQTLRVQIREDGVQLDQIVLSPTTYLSAAPGPLADDTTIVPKP